MNKKGIELAVTTIIIIVLGILILIGLMYFLTGGFKKLKAGTEPFLDSTEVLAVKEACRIACEVNNRIVYCCEGFDVGEVRIGCNDDRLEIDCSLDCAGFECG